MAAKNRGTRVPKPPPGADTGPVRTGPKRGDKGNPTTARGEIFGNPSRTHRMIKQKQR